MTKFPCVECGKCCRKNQKSILCDNCDRWMHLSCTGITCTQFEALGASDDSFFCIECCKIIFPFQDVTSDEFKMLFTEDSSKNDIISAISSFISPTNSIFTDQYLSINNFKHKYANNDDFLILHINIRSISKNIGKVEELLGHLEKIPEIIAVSETKLNHSFSNHLDGYNFVQANSSTKAGGVGIFVKNTIDFSVVNSYNLNVNACENIWIEVNLTDNKKSVIGVIYRHPSYQISDFHDNLEISLNKLSNNNINYYICGDINVDLLKCDNQPMIQKYNDMLFSMGCIPLINMPTRITHHSATLIDHIYTNNVKCDIQSHILLHDISDHLPVCALINNLKTRALSHTSLMRNTKNFDTERFILDLEFKLYGINEITPSNRVDVNEMFNKFVDIFSKTLEKHAPLKKASRKQLKLQQKPWITKAILISIKKKEQII